MEGRGAQFNNTNYRQLSRIIDISLTKDTKHIKNTDSFRLKSVGYIKISMCGDHIIRYSYHIDEIN